MLQRNKDDENGKEKWQIKDEWCRKVWKKMEIIQEKRDRVEVKWRDKKIVVEFAPVSNFRWLKCVKYGGGVKKGSFCLFFFSKIIGKIDLSH